MEAPQNYNYFDLIPEESLNNIFGFLDRSSFIKATSTCKRFAYLQFDMSLPAAIQLKALKQIDTIRALFLSDSDNANISIIRDSYTMNLYWDEQYTIQAYEGDDTGLYIRNKDSNRLSWTSNNADKSKWQSLKIRWTDKEGIMFDEIPNAKFSGVLIDYIQKIYERSKHLEKEGQGAEKWQFIIQQTWNYSTSSLLSPASNSLDSMSVD